MTHMPTSSRACDRERKRGSTAAIRMRWRRRVGPCLADGVHVVPWYRLELSKSVLFLWNRGSRRGLGRGADAHGAARGLAGGRRGNAGGDARSARAGLYGQPDTAPHLTSSNGFGPAEKAFAPDERLAGLRDDDVQADIYGSPAGVETRGGIGRPPLRRRQQQQ
jgi:hypothetical protein